MVGIRDLGWGLTLSANKVYMPLVKSLHLTRPKDRKISYFVKEIMSFFFLILVRTEKGNYLCPDTVLQDAVFYKHLDDSFLVEEFLPFF